MQFPHLTPLQSRFAACLGTSLVLLLIYFSIDPSRFAYAAELDSILDQDHNHHRKAGAGYDIDWGELEQLDDDRDVADYQADFLGMSRSIVGRAALDTVSLSNNVASQLNINANESQWYVFQKDEVFSSPGKTASRLPTNVTGRTPSLHKRALSVDELYIETEEDGVLLMKRADNTTRTVYLSINTCLQPSLLPNKTGLPGQITVYYSLKDSNQKPTARRHDGEFTTDQGYGSVAIANVTGNVYITLQSPTLPNDTFDGMWNYQIAASHDTFYHYYNNDTSFLWTVDTDSISALLSTYNLTGQNGSDSVTVAKRAEWMEATPPFTVKVFNNSSPSFKGIEKSYCGLSKLNMDYMQINTSITERGIGSNPKQQFHISSLLPGQDYFSVLAYDGDGSGSNKDVIAGGGQVWQSIQFSTKSDGNCRIIFDLPFCDAVAYAVPYNPFSATITNITDLATIYDSNAAALYKNFSYSLQQIPCNTTSTAQYSLTSNCSDCAADYKTWLCAVTIPRCEDFSDTADFLVPRNIAQKWPNGSHVNLGPQNFTSQLTYLGANSSRNPLIDRVIQPGPYKELLPCSQLCWNMVQTCPTALGFECPQTSALYAPLSKSYGTFDPSKLFNSDGQLDINQLSCNYLGVDWPTLGNDGGTILPSWVFLWFCMFAVMAFI